MSKPYAITYSKFDQVLWLDADNVPLYDPTYLFETRAFTETGTLFFKDYWQPRDSIFVVNEYSLLWELLGLPYRNEFEMESGQLLLDRRKTKKAMTMVMFLATTFEKRWLGPLALLWGDKCLFRMGFYMTNSSLYFVERPPAPLGYKPPDKTTTRQLATKGFTTCGTTMLQYDTHDKPLFLHRNEYKLTNDSATHVRLWDGIYEFTGNNPQTQYGVVGGTRDSIRKVTCYHPRDDTKSYFVERNVSQVYPDIVAVEEQFLLYAKEGVKLLPPTSLQKKKRKRLG